jgi:hypothetical protein
MALGLPRGTVKISIHSSMALQPFVGPWPFLQFGYHFCRWVDYIKMDLREIGWDAMDWIDLAQNRNQWRPLVNTAMNLRVP